MIETNELTRTLKTLLIPKAALIAYASENERNFFLEVRDIDDRGNMTEGRPVTLEFMNELVKGYSERHSSTPYGKIPSNLMYCDSRKGSERYVWYDILPLAEFFRERYSRELKRETSGFSDDARRRMLAYPWPGNVRELQNRVKRSVLVSESPLLEMEGLNTEIHQHNNETISLTAIRPLKDETQEKMNIINALKACNGHREQAAAMLKINPATLYRKMKKYGLK